MKTKVLLSVLFLYTFVYQVSNQGLDYGNFPGQSTDVYSTPLINFALKPILRDINGGRHLGLASSGQPSSPVIAPFQQQPTQLSQMFTNQPTDVGISQVSVQQRTEDAQRTLNPGQQPQTFIIQQNGVVNAPFLGSINQPINAGLSQIPVQQLQASPGQVDAGATLSPGQQFQNFGNLPVGVGYQIPVQQTQASQNQQIAAVTGYRGPSAADSQFSGQPFGKNQNLKDIQPELPHTMSVPKGESMLYALNPFALIMENDEKDGTGNKSQDQSPVDKRKKKKWPIQNFRNYNN